jgi:DNA repair ATPase RecN
LAREELPIEEEEEMPSEQPTAPFKAYEYSVISKSSTAETNSKVDSLNLLLKEELVRKLTVLEAKRKQLQQLEGKVAQRRRDIETLEDNLTLLTKVQPSPVETSRLEISAYESSIESMCRSIGSQSRRLKEQDGQVARRLHQLSETKLRLHDLRENSSKVMEQRRELHRMVYAYKRVLAQPSDGWQFTVRTAEVLTSLQCLETQDDTQHIEGIAVMQNFNQELHQLSYIATQLSTVQAQIASKVRQVEEKQLSSEVAKQADLLLN